MAIKCPHCFQMIDIKEAKMRSLPQLKYYWSVCIEIISDHLGYTKDETHEILKMMFLSEVRLLNEKSGIREVRITESTRNKTTAEIEKYYSDIRQWASKELSVFIPTQNEENYV